MLNRVLLIALALGAVSATELRFGFPHKTRGLVDDIGDIVSLIPVEEVTAALFQYAAGDAEVQDVVRYLQGPEWASLVALVASNPSWTKFKEFAAEKGVNVDEIVDLIHSAINGIEVPDVGGDMGGVKALVDALLVLIPGEQILALVEEKIVNSADFRELYGIIASEESREFVNTVLAYEEVQYIVQRLRDFGIDVDGIIEWVKSFLGWVRYVSPHHEIEYI